MPLFDSSGVDDDEQVPDTLAKLNPLEEVYSDYASTRVSLQGQSHEFFSKQAVAAADKNGCRFANHRSRSIRFVSPDSSFCDSALEPPKELLLSL